MNMLWRTLLVLVAVMFVAVSPTVAQQQPEAPVIQTISLVPGSSLVLDVRAVYPGQVVTAGIVQLIEAQPEELPEFAGTIASLASEPGSRVYVGTNGDLFVLSASGRFSRTAPDGTRFAVIAELGPDSTVAARLEAGGTPAITENSSILTFTWPAGFPSVLNIIEVAPIVSSSSADSVSSGTGALTRELARESYDIPSDVAAGASRSSLSGVAASSEAMWSSSLRTTTGDRSPGFSTYLIVVDSHSGIIPSTDTSESSASTTASSSSIRSSSSDASVMTSSSNSSEHSNSVSSSRTSSSVQTSSRIDTSSSSVGADSSASSSSSSSPLPEPTSPPIPTGMHTPRPDPTDTPAPTKTPTPTPTKTHTPTGTAIPTQTPSCFDADLNKSPGDLFIKSYAKQGAKREDDTCDLTAPAGHKVKEAVCDGGPVLKTYHCPGSPGSKSPDSPVAAGCCYQGACMTDGIGQVEISFKRDNIYEVIDNPSSRVKNARKPVSFTAKISGGIRPLADDCELTLKVTSRANTWLTLPSGTYEVDRFDGTISGGLRTVAYFTFGEKDQRDLTIDDWGDTYTITATASRGCCVKDRTATVSIDVPEVSLSGENSVVDNVKANFIGTVWPSYLKVRAASTSVEAKPTHNGPYLNTLGTTLSKFKITTHSSANKFNAELLPIWFGTTGYPAWIEKRVAGRTPAEFNHAYYSARGSVGFSNTSFTLNDVNMLWMYRPDTIKVALADFNASYLGEVSFEKTRVEIDCRKSSPWVDMSSGTVRCFPVPGTPRDGEIVPTYFKRWVKSSNTNATQYKQKINDYITHRNNQFFNRVTAADGAVDALFNHQRVRANMPDGGEVAVRWDNKKGPTMARAEDNARDKVRDLLEIAAEKELEESTKLLASKEWWCFQHYRALLNAGIKHGYPFPKAYYTHPMEPLCDAKPAQPTRPDRELNAR